jgi:hypothetical protein
VYGADPDTGALWQVGVKPGDHPVTTALDTEGETGAHQPGATESSGNDAQKPPRSGFVKIAVGRELSRHRARQSHFYTTSLIELVSKVTDHGYRNDGIAFFGFAPVHGALPLVRLSHSDGRYLYTTSLAEAYDALHQKRYVFDQTLCYVAPSAAPGLTSLYRLKSEAQEDALFTMSLLELQEAAEQFGYTTRGIAGHVLGIFVPGAVSVYRLSKDA